MPREKFNHLIKSRNILVGVIVFLIIVVFFFVLNTTNANKLNWGMQIAGISVSGLYPNEAKELLKFKCQHFLEKDFFLNHQGQYWQTSSEKLGIEINTSTTVNLCFKKNSIWWQLVSLFGYNIKPVWQINEEKLENFLQENLASIHQPAINASLIYDEKRRDFITTNSKEGVVVDKDKLKKDLAKNINNLQENDIEISLVKDRPEIVESEIQKAYQKAKILLEAAPFELTITENGEVKKIDTIDKEVLLNLINFEPVLDPNNAKNKILGLKFKQEKIKDYLITLAPLVNREPVDAQLSIKNNRVTAFALSEQGNSLEIKDNILILSKGIFQGKKEIQLKINKIQPKITTDSINNLGITALLAKGVSNFSGSPESRIHNIKIGTAKFNGFLIKPEEKFSFNNILGEIGPEQGYEPELVIKKDKTIPEYGGGLCQVSTTAFRGAVNAGLEITQRYAHAFPVKYYGPQGFDATIYPPFPDLRFINNTPNYILIQTKIIDYDLIFEFYGTDDGREVEIEGPYQYDIKEDGSMKARLNQRVYNKDRDIIIDKTFHSIYKSPDLYPIERNPLE
jgi:vancomycin resistance protein YoaR